MANTGKSPKDRLHGQMPRLTPRPTAASAARAARNTTNRNLNVPPQKLSPNRPPSSPSNKIKIPPPQRTIPKADSKSDIKSSQPSAVSISEVQCPIPTKPETASFIIEHASSANVDTSEDGLDIYRSVREQEDNEENANDNFVIDNMHDNIDSTQDPVTEGQIMGSAQSPAINTDSCSPSRTDVPESSFGTPHPQTTSAPTSRPQTPRMPSRPSTPNMPSRPTTPVHPALRKSLQSSRPNTPKHTRPKTPSSLPVPAPTRTQTPNLSAPPRTPVKEEDLKAMFISKQQQFQRMKKDLDIKQQAVLDVFDCLKNLYERMVQEGSDGCEGIELQDLMVFNVADWSSEEVAQLCREAVSSSGTDIAVEIFNTTSLIDENSLFELDSNVTKFPARFADLCLQAFTSRQELIDWIKDLVGRMQEDGRGECLDKIAYFNSQGLELCEHLRELKSQADQVVDTVAQLSKRAFRERNTLIAVGEQLVRETARLRHDIETRVGVINEMREIRAETETATALENMRKELEEERISKAALKDKLSTTESQLRQTRIRVTKMDRQLREAEASITSLTATVKSLEDQSRQREVHLEARARKLKESLKTGEVTSNQIATQRDALQAEVQKLKEQIESMTVQHKATIHDFNKEIKYLKNTLEDQRELNQKEGEQKKYLQDKLLELEKHTEELKTKINEYENAKLNEDLPTEREMDLWAELQATKDTLRMTEDEVTACKREKVKFLETLTKISESENKVGMQQKLAAELLSKEEMIDKMQIQMRELTKNIKLNEQKVIQYEQYVRDLQAHNRAVANCQDAPNGISYQDLQQEIMNLRMSLLDAVHRNEELSELLAQKEQQLEQQDKTSRAQARVIKVREELINMLKNKETEQSRELSVLQQDLEHRMKIVDEVNKQIASKAEEIQELFATLENKQQQIHRLEKIVLALEEQQRRAQAQRTRHEEKIAALEHELAAGNRRERKFLFF